MVSRLGRWAMETCSTETKLRFGWITARGPAIDSMLSTTISEALTHSDRVILRVPVALPTRWPACSRADRLAGCIPSHLLS